MCRLVKSSFLPGSLLVLCWLTLTISVSELQNKLGTDRLNKAYNYLRRARFDDRRPGTDINEDNIQRNLSEIVSSAEDRFRVEQLLFLEMHIDSWVKDTGHFWA